MSPGFVQAGDPLQKAKEWPHLKELKHFLILFINARFDSRSNAPNGDKLRQKIRNKIDFNGR